MTNIITLNEILACEPNDFGWRPLPDGSCVKIGDSIEIGGGVKIGYGVVIGNGAKIGNWVKTGNGAVIGDGAKIGNGAVIGDGVWIGDGAKIGNYVVIGDGVEIGNRVKIGSGVQIGSGVEITQTPTYIQGSRFFMSQVTDDGLTIQSGCITKPLSWWRENIRRCAERHKYTPEQVEEYAAYIDLFTRLAELRQEIE